MIHLNSQSNVITSYAMWRRWLGFGELLNRLLGEEEWYQSFDSLRALFESIADDVDGHYLLSKTKFLHWLQKISDSNIEICNCLFPILDRDADGFITLNEFALGILCTFMEGQYQGPAPSAYNRARRQLLFLYYDIQGIGVWTRREWELVVQDFMKYYHYNMRARHNVEGCGRSVAICIESLRDSSASNSKASGHLRRLEAFCMEERGIVSYDAFYEACEQGLLSESFGVLSWQPKVASQGSTSVDLNNVFKSVVQEGMRLTQMAAQTVPKLIESIWSHSNTLDSAIATSFLLADPDINLLSPNRTGDACCGNEVTTVYSENAATSSNRLEDTDQGVEEGKTTAISPSRSPDSKLDRCALNLFEAQTGKEETPHQNGSYNKTQPIANSKDELSKPESSKAGIALESETKKQQQPLTDLGESNVAAQQSLRKTERMESAEEQIDTTERPHSATEGEEAVGGRETTADENGAVTSGKVQPVDAATAAIDLIDSPPGGCFPNEQAFRPAESSSSAELMVTHRLNQHKCGVGPLQYQASICPSEDETKSQQCDGVAMLVSTTSAGEDVDAVSVVGDGGAAFVYSEEKVNSEALDLGERVVRMYAKRCIGFVNGDHKPPARNSQRFTTEVQDISRDLSFIARIVGQHFAKEDTLIDLNKVTGKDEFHVIGDLDGKVETLRAALSELFFAGSAKKKSRLPQTTIIPSNITVIFAGNIVGGDDEPVSTDILWVLAGVWALKIMFPDKVFILRGPNERNNKKIDQTITEIIGVAQGVVLWNQIYDVFEYTPIGALGSQWIWLFGGTLTVDMAEHLNEVRRMPRPLVLDYIKDIPPLVRIIRDSYDAMDVSKNAILRHYGRSQSQLFPDIIVERQKVTMKITTNDLPLVLRVPIGGIPKLLERALGATLMKLVS